MKRFVSFFEGLAKDFTRAVAFCESVFGIKMPAMDCGHEKMAFSPRMAAWLWEPCHGQRVLTHPKTECS